ncbi:transcription regulator [Candidatus Thiomargarita nelsonii]|uniref:Transcription regulator n=1 Tax=Candidatus Thiomargarita nelsonii TaxID=1003181 RepID=A0A176RX62_9GAMM|nr:transcription regulator [Candidatus Thiomargarita nelsonii]
MMSEVLEKTTACWMNAENFLSVPKTEAEYDKAVALLNQLIDTVGEDETHILAGLMETLGVLIETYENKHYHMPEVSGREILIYLMEEHGLKSSRLSNEIGTENEVLEVLNGQRDLNTRQIHALSNRFHVPAEVFL